MTENERSNSLRRYSPLSLFGGYSCNRLIEKVYSDHRAGTLDAAVKYWPGPIQGAAKKSIVVVDSDFLKDFETVDYQKGKLWNLPWRGELDRTKKEHEAEKEWELQWMKDHRKEFAPTP